MLEKEYFKIYNGAKSLKLTGWRRREQRGTHRELICLIFRWTSISVAAWWRFMWTLLHWRNGSVSFFCIYISCGAWKKLYLKVSAFFIPVLFVPYFALLQYWNVWVAPVNAIVRYIKVFIHRYLGSFPFRGERYTFCSLCCHYVNSSYASHRDFLLHMSTIKYKDSAKLVVLKEKLGGFCNRAVDMYTAAEPRYIKPGCNE